MSAENVRAVLFRILTDSDFHNLMLVNPGEALKDYDLTDDERRILTTPDKDLYKALEGADVNGINISLHVAPPTVRITIPIFFEPPNLLVPSPLLKDDDEKIVQLVKSIQNAVGQDRFDNIMQLVQQMQGENQIKKDAPQQGENQIRSDAPKNE
jgi:hypothetical protein